MRRTKATRQSISLSKGADLVQVEHLCRTISTHAQIAAHLVIGERTVKSHVNNILSKLRVVDRTQAAIYAWREGIMY